MLIKNEISEKGGRYLKTRNYGVRLWNSDLATAIDTKSDQQLFIDLQHWSMNDKIYKQAKKDRLVVDHKDKCS